MLYRPTYCCNCGDKIERVEWRPLTSRRFCEVCETEFKFDDWLPRVVGICLALFGAFGVGAYFSAPAESLQIAERASLPSLESESRRSVSFSQSGRLIEKQRENPEYRDLKKTDELANSERIQLDQNESIREAYTRERVKKPQVISSEETLYFCGAETKKGKPCSRRVKGKRRCWQHAGKEAMLPQNKLIVPGQ